MMKTIIKQCKMHFLEGKCHDKQTFVAGSAGLHSSATSEFDKPEISAMIVIFKRHFDYILNLKSKFVDLISNNCTE